MEDLRADVLSGAVKPLFPRSNCPDQKFAAPGPSAGHALPGVSETSNVLINGVYQP